MSNLILYTTEDGRSQIKLRAQEQTVWLTQLEMAELFATSKQNIGQHLKSIFEEAELRETSVVKQHFTTAADGKNYLTLLYNLDAILAVGYRVRSPRGVQFRRWASTVLKEYLLKGFVMDNDRPHPEPTGQHASQTGPKRCQRRSGFHPLRGARRCRFCP